MMLPLTPLRGVPVLGMTNYDGAWWVPGLRKDRVRTLFHFPVWRGFGINVISWNRPKRWWFRYRESVIKLLMTTYDLRLHYYDDHGERVADRPCTEFYWSVRPEGRNSMLVSVFSRVDGGYVGSPEEALMLMRRGIAPELRTPASGCCSIGFCEREQKWWGWSPRAISGFGIGDVVSEGDCTNSSGWTDDYLAEHPEDDERLPVGFKAETLDDAKRMACAFAESVG